ncbi:MAG: sigma-70 family RNA polymerase sigma factor [Planctomycetota bacterium]
MPRDWNTEIDEPGTTRSTLLERVRLKDAVAWNRLVEMYGPVVYSWCRRSNCQPSDAVDVVQEVFLAVAQGIDRLHRDRPGDSFRAWLRTITKHKVVDHFRRLRQAPSAGGTAIEPAFNQRVEFPFDDEDDSDKNTAERAELLQRCMLVVREDFTDKTWQAFWLSTVEGHPTAEIAARLDMNANAIRQARFRVLKRIREEFGSVFPTR